MNTRKSTLMADVYAIHRARQNKSINSKTREGSLVKVGGIGMQKPTLVGNAVKLFRSDSHVVVGAEEKPASTSPVVEIQSESRQIANKVKDSLGETTAKFVLGSMVIGPPVVGGLLWGVTGLIVGATISSPFVLVFVWSVLK